MSRGVCWNRASRLEIEGVMKIKDVISPELVIQLHRSDRRIEPLIILNEYRDPKYKTLMLCLDHLHYCQTDENFENLTIDELNTRIDKCFSDIPDFPRVSANGLDA